MKPTDFFIGVTRFFSVLIPGFLVISAVYVVLFKRLEPSQIEWAYIAVLSYAAGQLLFALGAVFDFTDKISLPGDFKLMQQVSLARGLDKNKDNQNFQWSKSKLAKDFEAGFVDVGRSEADSKMFRSIIIPILLAPMFLDNYIVSVEIMSSTKLWSSAVLLATTCFVLYRIKRGKAITKALRHVITLNEAKRDSAVQSQTIIEKEKEKEKEKASQTDAEAASQS
jgi:hypothetical protein